MIAADFIFVIAAILFLGVLYIRRIYGYWQDRGVPFIEPKFPKGCISSLGKTEHFFEMIKRFYFELKGEGSVVGGTFFMTTPVAVALDLDFVKTILVKDFHHFHDRGFYVNERDDPLMANLLSIGGPGWKGLRAKLSPTFTSGRMKLIFPILKDISDRFVQCLNEEISVREEIELSDYMSRFMIDIIANCAFGLDCNSLRDPNNEFYIKGQEASDILIARTLKSIFMTSFKKLSVFLRLRVISEEMTHYYTKIVADTMAYRDENNVQRDDFLSMLMKLRNRELNGVSGKSMDFEKITNNEIVGNAFLFIVAGYHTSAASLEFCILELARNTDIQDRLRNEIRSVLEQHENTMSYNALMGMKYLDNVVNETFRKHPTGGTLTRCLSDDYKVPNSDLILEKGTQIFIPVLGIHHDPEIYPDPQKFDPERFNPEEIKMRHPYAFLAFGEGPRNCIGAKFAMIQTKIGIASLILNYKFAPCAKTNYPIRYKKVAGILHPMGGCCVKMEKL